MTRRLVLVGCGGEKEDSKDYSWSLYKTDYFKKKMTLAMLMGEPAVLSAKYGYVKSTERIEPYDEDLREKEAHEIDSWALLVSNDIPDFYQEVVILASKKYRVRLKKILQEDGYTVYTPFDSDELTGIGKQISWCKETSEEIVEGEDPEAFLVNRS